jgi:imidazolonepropionase
LKSLAVLNASQLVTVAGPDLGIIRNGGMLIRDGKIDSAGPSREIEEKAANAEIVDAEGRVVLPGFVDAHTHLVFDV